MRQKLIFAGLLALAVIFSLAACSDNKKTTIKNQDSMEENAWYCFASFVLPSSICPSEAMLKAFLSRYGFANIYQYKGYEENTPLHKASEINNYKIVRLLIAKGADVNARNTYRNTPLHYARSDKIAALLIAKGAVINARDKRGQISRRNDKKTAIKNQDSMEENAWYCFASFALPSSLCPNEAILKVFLSGYGFANIYQYKGYEKNTPLHKALETGNKKIAYLLIAKGADVNARNNDGYTPLHYARSDKLAALLIAKGADINARNHFGRTPLHKALESSSDKIVRLLIAKGADVNARNHIGWTPLHEAASRGRDKVAALLIAKGADVHARNHFGWTPLQAAEDNGNSKTAAIIKRAGGRK